MRHLVVLSLLLVGCAAQPEKPDDPCKSEYAGTIMECAKPKQRPRRDLVKICEIRGSDRQCYYVTRDELRRVLGQL